MTTPQPAVSAPAPAARRVIDAASLSRRERNITLAGVLAALLLAGLDQTIVATAGPAIQRDLQIAPSLYAWLTTAYLVMATVMLPIYGKLSDRFGRKPILIIGVAIFLAGSLLCGVLSARWRCGSSSRQCRVLAYIPSSGCRWIYWVRCCCSSGSYPS